MYSMESNGSEVTITFSNGTHKLVEDSRGFIIKVKENRTNKKTGELEEVYIPLYYYTSLKSVVNQLCKMKLISMKQTIDLMEYCKELATIKSEIIDEIEKSMKKLIIVKKEVDEPSV